MPNRVFLRLDINTNNSGYTIVNSNGRIVTFGVIETSTCACTLDAAQAIGEVLQRVRTEFAACEWTVAVEDYLEVF